MKSFNRKHKGFWNQCLCCKQRMKGENCSLGLCRHISCYCRENKTKSVSSLCFCRNYRNRHPNIHDLWQNNVNIFRFWHYVPRAKSLSLSYWETLSFLFQWTKARGGCSVCGYLTHRTEDHSPENGCDEVQFQTSSHQQMILNAVF